MEIDILTLYKMLIILYILLFHVKHKLVLLLIFCMEVVVYTYYRVKIQNKNP